MGDFWRTSLERLRDRFARGAADFPDLRCAMRQGTAGAGEPQKFRLSLPPELRRLDSISQVHPHINPNLQWTFWFFDGQAQQLAVAELAAGIKARHLPSQDDTNRLEAAKRQFRAVANDANAVVSSAGDRVKTQLPPLPGPALGSDDWLELVFRLAWNPPPGSLLRAKRCNDGDGDEEFHCLLPVNVFDASAAVIDVLLAPSNSGVNGHQEDPLSRDAMVADAADGQPSATVSERLEAYLTRHPEAIQYSCRQLADALGCGRSQVAASEPFKRLQTARELTRLGREQKAQQDHQRRSNRHRKSKASDLHKYDDSD